MQCMIPGTDVAIEAFPHLLRIGNLEIPLENKPFLHPFTLELDLEKNCVWVFGKEFRVKIKAAPGGIEMISEKKTKFFAMNVRFSIPKEVETLSLGSHKAQDWDLVERRRDLKEILPILFSLTQKISPSEEPFSQSLLSLEEYYRTSFHHMLVPRKREEASSLFQEAFGKIRSLFFLEKEHHYFLLPNNFFPEGRMLNVQTKIGSLDIEWTKNKLRRAVFRARVSGEIYFSPPKQITSFRWKGRQNEKGIRHAIQNPFVVESGRTYFLDQWHENTHC